MGPVTTPFPGADVAISRDGSLVAVAGGGRGEVATWDVLTGRLLAGLDGVNTVPAPRAPTSAVPPQPWPSGAATGSTSARFAVHLREVSARTMRVRRTWPAPALTTNRRIVTVGDRLFAGGEHGQLAVDLRDGRMLWVAGGDTSGVSGCHQLDVSTKVGAVYCATDTGQVVVRDARHRGALRPPPRAPVREGRLAGRDGWRQHPAGVQWRRFRASPGGVSTARVSGVPSSSPVGSPRVDTTRPVGCCSSVDRRRAARARLSTPLTGTPVLRLRVPGPAVWLSADTVGVLGRRPTLVDVPSGQVRRTALDGSRPKPSTPSPAAPTRGPSHASWRWLQAAPRVPVDAAR